MSFFVIFLLAAVQMDPQTGLWFPPYASRDAYLKREAPYIRDVQRAFTENPQLAHDVCEQAMNPASPVPPVTDPSTRQLITMFQMTCAATMAKAREQAAAAKKPDVLGAMFAEEAEKARSVPADMREEALTKLVDSLDNSTMPPLRDLFRAVALDPSSALPLQRGFGKLMWLGDNTAQFPKKTVTAFLESLYRTRAQSPTESKAWRGGLGPLLLFAGKFDEAREAARLWLNDAPEKSKPSARMLIALADEAAGKQGAFDGAIAQCESCLGAAATLVRGVLDAMTTNAPRAFPMAALQLEKQYGDDWPQRLDLIREASKAAPALAERRLYEVIAEHGLASGVTETAVYYLSHLASDSDPAHAAPLYDCWLKLRGVVVPPLPADGWSRFAALPDAAPRNSECFQNTDSHLPPPDSWCVLHALQLRERAALDARQWDVARESVEMLISITLATKSSPRAARMALANLASFEKNGGDAEEVATIWGYLKRNEHDAYAAGQLAQWKGRVAEGAPEPWSRAAAASTAQSKCPPAMPRELVDAH